jgi:hypothetical protein
MTRRIVQELVSATQTKIDEWRKKINEAVLQKNQGQQEYEDKKALLLPQLKEGHDKGLSTRELEKITGINHTTIAKWLREERS